MSSQLSWKVLGSSLDSSGSLVPGSSRLLFPVKTEFRYFLTAICLRKRLQLSVKMASEWRFTGSSISSSLTRFPIRDSRYLRADSCPRSLLYPLVNRPSACLVGLMDVYGRLRVREYNTLHRAIRRSRWGPVRCNIALHMCSRESCLFFFCSFCCALQGPDLELLLYLQFC